MKHTTIARMPTSRITSITKIHWIAVTSFVALSLATTIIHAQYDNEYDASNQYGGGYGGGGGGYGGGDERPKLHLGIRLKIPAIKFELPRLSLPKITISAKIRQPNRPRTINLPEINLDTTSKVATPPGSHPAGGGGGYYPAASNSYSSGGDYGQGGYGQGGYQSGSKESTISFSSSAEESYGGGGGYGNQYQQQQQQQYPQQSGYQQQRHQQPQSYGATNVQPTYWMPQASGHYSDGNQFAGLQQQHQPPQNPDLGFNDPVFVDQNQLGHGNRVMHPTANGGSSYSANNQQNHTVGPQPQLSLQQQAANLNQAVAHLSKQTAGMHSNGGHRRQYYHSDEHYEPVLNRQQRMWYMRG